jgi:hypothetical protein
MAITSDRTPDMSRALTDLTRAIASLDGNIGQMNGGNSSSRPGSNGGGRAKTEAGPAKDLKELKDTIKQTDKDLKSLRKGIDDTGKTFDKLYDVQSEAIKGVVNNQKLSDKAHEKLIDKLHKTATAGSALGANMQSAAEKLAFLETKIEESGTFLAGYSDALKEAGADTLASIDDYAKLRKTLKKLDKDVELSADVKEHIAKQEYKQAADILDRQAKDSNKLRNDVKKTSNSFNFLNKSSQALGTGLNKATDTVGLGFVKEAAKWGGAVALITGGVKEVYSQFWQTASSGFGGAFIDLSINAIKLGVSLQDLTSLAKENMVQVGKMGMKGFVDSLAESRLQLMQLGLTSVEAAKMRAVLNENARLTGVDIKNKGELNSATQSQINTFATLRATTGETLEALASQTKAILQDTDTQKVMASLNKQQRVQMLQNINLERTRLTTMGLTNEAALGVVKTLNSISNMKATDRIEGGNKLMAASAALGMDSGDAQKAAGILQKGRNQTGDDKKFLADFAKQMAAKQDEAQSGDLNSQMIGNVTEEWSSILNPIADNMRQGNLGRAMTPAEVQANKELGKVNAGIADSSAKIDSWMRLIQSPLVAIAAGVAGIGLIMLKKAAAGKKGSGDSGSGDSSSPESGSGKGKVKGKAGSSTIAHADGTPMAGTSGNASPQIDHIARKGFDYKGPEDKGYGALDRSAKQRQADKAYAGAQRDGSGRAKTNSSSIASGPLQERLKQAKMDRERFAGPPREYTPPQPSVMDGIKKKFGSAASSVGGAAGKVGGAVGSIASGGAKLVTGAVAKMAKFALKAVPFVGLAIAGFEAISGGMEAVNRAGEIFGVDTQKQALTTSQKVSAGIAGALNTISFGLIPTDSTARLINDVATDGVGVLTDYAEKGIQYFYNTAIPALYNGFKSVLGFVWDAITGLFTGGDGSGGKSITSTIMDALVRSVKFMGTIVLKGIMQVGADLIGGIADKIPDWLGGAAIRENVKMMKGFASEETKVSDFDNELQAKERKERDAKKVIRDKANAKGDAKVQGTPDTPTDNLGLVNQYGQALTADQLAAQGVQGKPATSVSPGVGTSGPGATAANGGSSTTVNNTTNNTTTPPKTESENLLAGILAKMTSLVDLTDKGLKLAEQDYKTSSTQRLIGNSNDPGYSPSLASFMNMSI